MDVTIPTNLVDLLANLPADQISADNLQKMFRDSVADRRTLLNGFNKIINKVYFKFFNKQLFFIKIFFKIKKDDPIIKNKSDNQSSFLSPLQSASNLFVLNTDRLSTAKMIPGTKIDSMNVSKIRNN